MVLGLAPLMAGWGEPNKPVRELNPLTQRQRELFERRCRVNGYTEEDTELADWATLVHEHGKCPVVVYTVRHADVTEGMTLVETRLATDGVERIVHTTWESVSD